MTGYELVRTHALGGFGDLADSAMDLLDSTVKAIQINSAWGPQIRIERPFQKTAEPGVGSALAKIMKPKITLEMRSGWGGPRSFAPYGDPGESKFPIVAAALAFLVLAPILWRR